MIVIINKPLLLHLVGCPYYMYQWRTVKQISIWHALSECRILFYNENLFLWWFESFCILSTSSAFYRSSTVFCSSFDRIY